MRGLVFGFVFGLLRLAGLLAVFLVGTAFAAVLRTFLGAATVVQAVKIARFELGNTVEGLIFRLGVHPDKHQRDDEKF